MRIEPEGKQLKTYPVERLKRLSSKRPRLTKREQSKRRLDAKRSKMRLKS